MMKIESRAERGDGGSSLQTVFGRMTIAFGTVRDMDVHRSLAANICPRPTISLSLSLSLSTHPPISLSLSLNMFTGMVG